MSLQFLVTKYVGVLPEPLRLYEKFGYVLDNVRTEKERDELAEYLWRILPQKWKTGEWRGGHPPDPSERSLGWQIDRFLGRAPSNNSDVEDGLETFKRLAEVLIVLRYTDTLGVWVPKEGDDEWAEQLAYESLEQRLITYATLLAFLSDASPVDEYYGGNELTYPAGGTGPVDEDSGGRVFLRASTQLVTDAAHPPQLDQLFWPTARNGIVSAAREIADGMDGGHTDTLLYAGDVLRAASDTHDARFKLVLLVGAIEMFLTHNPDTSRYNVEDSIGKQFILKTSILCYMSGRKDLTRSRHDLRQLYSLRSAISHGNFSALSKLLKRPTNVDDAIADIVHATYDLLRIVIRQFLRDPPFVTFLKEN